ncbi:histidinol dehydrogenase [bacterium]|nr:histidinol dehydrogenase [bacterium]
MIKIYNTKDIAIEKILSRENTAVDSSIEKIVANILLDVKNKGDEALLYYCQKFDGANIRSLKVTKEEILEGYNQTDKAFIDTLAIAKENIEAFHKMQLPKGYEIKKDNGAIVGQRVLPLKSVGLYVPGGTACYPSSVLMNAIPAIIAGVSEIIMVTPPNKEGKIDNKILAAAYILGINNIYKIGGAQAIGALAFGTQTVPKVDKIVGPGNIYVATAKKQVFGLCDIDMIAGPSEILIIADEQNKKEYVAADMLGQAEHDKKASAVLLTTSLALAEEVKEEIEKQLATLPREEIARQAIENNGKIIVVSSIEQAIEIANIIAPEHLELCVNNPFDYLNKISNAGSVFLGEYSPEALGDYLAGTNHTLPTSGTARFSSPLSVEDFVKRSQYIYYTKEALMPIADNIILFAEREGLAAHGNSVKVRK